MQYPPVANPQPQYVQPVIPAEYRPLGAWAYFGYSLLFSIPIAGFILLLVFSFSNANINRRNYARSFFCWYVIAAIAVVILLIAGFSIGSFFSNTIFNL